MISKPLNILIIGGSGFVSGTLTRVALNLGHHVHVITRGQKPIPAGALAYTIDRHHHAAFQEIIQNTQIYWNLVVDCIGYEPQDAQQDIAVFRDHAEHLVFISTDFVFDPDSRTCPQRDDHQFYTEHGYGGLKRQCELQFLHADAGPMKWTILRPCHIYGPGSLLGCLPEHSRDPNLIQTLKDAKPLNLVGAGHFLQQPIFAADLAQVILSCPRCPVSHAQTYLTYGPDVIKSRDYYQIIADHLGVKLHIRDIPLSPYLSQNPDARPFFCHRICTMQKLRDHGLYLPATPVQQGLNLHLQALLNNSALA